MFDAFNELVRTEGSVLTTVLVDEEAESQPTVRSLLLRARCGRQSQLRLFRVAGAAYDEAGG